MKQVVFFPDEPAEHVIPVRDRLAKTYHCIRSSTDDEFHQTFLQSGKFIIFFSDPLKAVKFMNEHRKGLLGLEYFVVSYLGNDGNYDEKSQRILQDHKVNVFKKSQAHDLLDEIDKFLRTNSSDFLDDLQFIMPAEKGAKNGTTK